MIVRVTRDDIRRGIPGDPCRCPVARAVKRTLRWKYVGVDEYSIGRKMNHKQDYYKHQFNTPPIVRRFIWNFDTGKNVKHFWFYLPVKKKKK